MVFKQKETVLRLLIPDGMNFFPTFCVLWVVNPLAEINRDHVKRTTPLDISL